MSNNISQPQDIFDKFLAECNRGVRLNPNDIVDPAFPNDFLLRARNQIDNFSEAYNDDSKYYLYLTISGKIEAFSFLVKDTGFIAVSLDTILIFRILFLRILSDPESFSDVGDANLEEPLRPPYLTGLPKKTEEIKVESRSPKCVMREAFSRILTINIFHFLVAHELAHLSNGHLAWMNSIRKDSLISEVTGNNRSMLSTITQQALEMDADCSAVKQIFTANHKIYENRAEITEGMDEESLKVHNAAYGTPDDIIYLLIYTSTIFFRIFDDVENIWDKQSLSVRSHPPSPFRNIWISAVLQKIIKNNARDKKYGSQLSEKVPEIGKKAFNDAVQALGRLTNKMPNLDGIYGAISNEYSYYPDSLLDHWAKVRPHLEPFSKGPPLAPIQQ